MARDIIDFSLVNDPPLSFAATAFTEILEEEGHPRVTCPCCGRDAQIYDRRIDHRTGTALVAMYETSIFGKWIHMPRLLSRRTNNFHYARHWGLIREMNDDDSPEDIALPRRDPSRYEDEDEIEQGNGHRSGYWKLTLKGSLYIENKITIPKYVRIYNDEVLCFVGPQVGIDKAFGKRFEFKEYMRGYVPELESVGPRELDQ